jgi:hypothetical protein
MSSNYFKDNYFCIYKDHIVDLKFTKILIFIGLITLEEFVQNFKPDYLRMLNLVMYFISILLCHNVLYI